MPLCRDPGLLRPLLEGRLPQSQSVYNLAFGVAGVRPTWLRADSLEDPQAVLCRTRRFALFATDARAATRVIAETPRNMRLRFGSTPMRFYRLIKRHWPGPDRGRPTWLNACYLYCLRPGRLVIDRSHRVTSLRPDDAAAIRDYWPYGRSAEHLRRRIATGPSCGIRHQGRLAAWGLTHDDGSMGFLHVLKEYRGHGMARALTTALAGRLLRLGATPFLYIVKRNRPSISLTESMGFERIGEYGWFGTD
jgi:GNAT superfamily N-acetyltransferase